MRVLFPSIRFRPLHRFKMMLSWLVSFSLVFRDTPSPNPSNGSWVEWRYILLDSVSLQQILMFLIFHPLTWCECQRIWLVTLTRWCEKTLNTSHVLRFNRKNLWQLITLVYVTWVTDETVTVCDSSKCRWRKASFVLQAPRGRRTASPGPYRSEHFTYCLVSNPAQISLAFFDKDIVRVH